MLSTGMMAMKIKLSIKEYLDEIRPYLSDIINEHNNK